MPKQQLSKAQKAEIKRKNEENSAKQRLAAAPAKELKQEQRRQAEDTKRAEKQIAEDIKRYYESVVKYNTIKIVRNFVKKIRKQIWLNIIAKITKLSEFILLQFCTEEGKSVYCILEVKAGLKLDLSVYKYYILPQMISFVLESAKCEEISNVNRILKKYFSSFDETQLIKYIPLSTPTYNNLVQQFTSGYHNGVSSVLSEILINTLKKFAEDHNLKITNVSNHKGREIISTDYYETRAKNLYTDYAKYNSDSSSEEEDYISPISFETGISYYNGCLQCDGNNLYKFVFCVGFDPNTKMHSIVYKNIHYTFLDMNNLFKQLLHDELIYVNPICQNCCKHNEVQIEVSSIMTKLSGLMYVGNPKYRFKYPMSLYNPYDYDDDDYVEHVKKECITIKLSEESDQCNEGLSEIQIIKNSTYVKVEEPLSKSDVGYYGRTKTVIKKITQYTARVPIFSEIVLWRPEFNVTIAFRNMQIAFMLCQSMMTMPYVWIYNETKILTYIFSFIIIPDMYSNTRNLEFDLGSLDNFKLIEGFANKVNFRL
jgi:hypothetical protein